MPRRILASYQDYYHRSRCHLSLDKDAPDGRPVQPVGRGEIVALPQVGGLPHRYERLAARAGSRLWRQRPLKFTTDDASPGPALKLAFSPLEGER